MHNVGMGMRSGGRNSGGGGGGGRPYDYDRGFNQGKCYNVNIQDQSAGRLTLLCEPFCRWKRW